jgi:hypothetical protein
MEQRRTTLRTSLTLVAGLTLLGTDLASAEPRPSLSPNANTEIVAAPAQACALLDDATALQRMDGLFFNLAWACNRRDLLGPKLARAAAQLDGVENASNAILAVDAGVNNPAGEVGTSRTQSETSIAVNENTGTLCSGYNDSYEFFGATGGGGFTGFARSTNGGASWVDQGAVGSTSFGDASMVWRRVDGLFYLATLESGGALSVWRSNDDCDSFTKISIPTTGNDDKEILIADNTTTSPGYGNLYLVWTDFGVAGTPIRFVRSTNGGTTWSAPLNLGTGTVQGAWPAVAPNGDIYVAWLSYASFPNGNITVRVSRSTNQGTSFAAVTAPLSNAVSPRDATASANCGRPALRGNIRYLASPQITVTSNGVVHVVYSRDPGAFNSGDVVNVYYKRSTNNGSTWSAEFRISSVGTRDQFFPTIQSRGNTIVASWYDRRTDTGNLRYDYYSRTSTDAGVTWAADVRESDVDSGVVLDPNLAACYHGDYDQSVITASGAVVQWSDDRNGTPDVWTDNGP